MTLAEVYKYSRQLAKVTCDNYIPETLDQAYDVQRKNMQACSKIAAWKLGGTTEFTQALFDTDCVYYGPLDASTVFAAASNIVLPANIDNPVGEAEVCFRLSDAVRKLADVDIDAVPISEFVVSVAPSIELPWSAFPLPNAGLKVLVADCCAAGALIMGVERALSDDLIVAVDSAVSIKSERDGVLGEGNTSNIIGGPAYALRDFLKLAKFHKLALSPGQFVATGGCTPCVKLPIGEEIIVTFSCLGSLSFSLER